MEFQTASEAKEKLSGLKAGFILFSGVNVEKTNPQIDQLVMDSSAKALRRFPTPESILEDPIVQACRSLFSMLGIDPTKERPSGEALIRRISSGKGIYRINTAVDVNNVVSMLTGLPCGSYDADKLHPPITFLIGKPGEAYIGIAGKELDAENKLLTRDSVSIFGGPTADSGRTAITHSTKNVLMLIYLPPNSPEETLQKAIVLAKEYMPQATGCRVENSGTYAL